MNKYLEFYKKYKISPVVQDIKDFNSTFGRGISYVSFVKEEEDEIYK